MVVKRGLDDKIFDTINTVLMFIVLVVVLYPLYFVVIASISEPYEVVRGNILFLPKGFTLESYQHVLRNNDVWTGYRNTIIYTISGTIISLFLTLTSAYALSKKRLPGRSFLTWVFLFIMYFNGGLVPTFLLVRSIGLLNQPHTLIILGAFSVWNFIVTRTYFQSSIPEEICESAEIDGAGPLRTFVTIVLPLSAPIIAVMTLFYAVAQWNSFFNALIYISNRDYFPLQLILRNILIVGQTALSSISEGADASEIEAMARLLQVAQSMRYSLIMIASLPLLIAYTFVQKYFIKGIMIGSLKG